MSAPDAFKATLKFLDELADALEKKTGESLHGLRAAVAMTLDDAFDIDRDLTKLLPMWIQLKRANADGELGVERNPRVRGGADRGPQRVGKSLAIQLVQLIAGTEPWSDAALWGSLRKAVAETRSRSPSRGFVLATGSGLG